MQCGESRHGLSDVFPVRHASFGRATAIHPEAAYVRQQPSLRQLRYYVAPSSTRLDVVDDLLEDRLSDEAKDRFDEAEVA